MITPLSTPTSSNKTPLPLLSNKSQQGLYAREGKQETQNLFDTLRKVISTQCFVSQADLDEKK